MNKVKGVLLIRPKRDNGSEKQVEKYLLLQDTNMRDFNLEFGKAAELEWIIGIDPASKFTGLAMVDTTLQFIILLDCKRDDKQDPESYFKELFYLIKRLVSGKKIVLTINEKPFKSKYNRAGYVLIALRGKIESWVREIPELAASKFVQIFVNTWKSRVVDKGKGSGRYNEKGAVAEDLCDMFPALVHYYESCTQGDLDSFDALGIVIGYRRCAYTERGAERIFGDKEYSHNSLIGYKWCSVAEINREGFFNRMFGDAYPIFKLRSLVFNTDYSLKDNVIMASTSNDAVVTIVPNELLQEFQWKLGIDITEDGKVLLMFIYRLGSYTPVQRKFLTSVFDYSEEMSGNDA